MRIKLGEAKRIDDLDGLRSKAGHSDVTDSEAKQGLLGIYLFLYNVIAMLKQTAIRPRFQATSRESADRCYLTNQANYCEPQWLN